MDARTPLAFMSSIARVDVPAAATHLFIRGGIDAVLVSRSARNGVQPDVRKLAPVVDPHIVAGVRSHHVRDVVTIEVRRRQVFEEHVRRLDDVIVDTYQHKIVNQHVRSIGKRVLTSSSALGRVPNQ